MPWEVREHEGQWCVFVEGEEGPIEGGCHDSEEEAEDHLQALYADEEMKATDEIDDLAGDLIEDMVDEVEEALAEALDEEPVEELADDVVEDLMAELDSALSEELVDEVEEVLDDELKMSDEVGDLAGELVEDLVEELEEALAEALDEEPVEELADDVVEDLMAELDGALSEELVDEVEEVLDDELKMSGEGEEEEEEEEDEDEQPEKRARSSKSPTLLTTFEAEIHRQFTLMADSFYANGNLTREERIALSNAIGDALSAFTMSLEGMLPPEVLNRSPYLDVLPEGAPVVQKSVERLRAIWMASKGVPGPVVVRRVMKSSKPLPAKLAIKSLGRNRVGGYLCLWGSPNLKDLTGEWFAPDTAELTTVFDAIGAIPALYHHAGDRLIKSMVPALVDVMEKDDVGLWIEAQVQKRREYDNFIAPLVEEGLLGWSSGTLPQARRVDKSTGKILRWPIVEASMTPTPAEWRMAVQWPVTNLKAIYRQAGLALPSKGPVKRTASKTNRASAIRQELERLRRLAR